MAELSYAGIPLLFDMDEQVREFLERGVHLKVNHFKLSISLGFDYINLILHLLN